MPAMNRDLLMKVIDDVFDVAIEDASVIEEIYTVIREHEIHTGITAEAELASHRRAVTVKPLEWGHYDSGDAYARSMITPYFAHTDGTWCVRNGNRIQAGSTLEEAKAAAQQHYEASIMSALTVSPDGQEELIRKDKHEALMDSHYRAGAAAGWNAAHLPPQEAAVAIANLTKVEKGDLSAISRAEAVIGGGR